MRYTVTFIAWLTPRACTRLSLDAIGRDALSWHSGSEEIGRWARAGYQGWKGC